MGFTVLAVGSYISVNYLLSQYVKSKAKHDLDASIEFKQQLNYVANNSMSVICSQANLAEHSDSRNKLFNTLKTGLNTSMATLFVTTTSMLFNNFLGFYMLQFTVPSIVLHPELYFDIRHLQNLIEHMSSSLWSIFSRVASSSTFTEAGNKLSKFLDIAESYHTLRKTQALQIDRSPNHSLSFNITLQYPQKEDPKKQQVLIHLDRKLASGEDYAVCGQSGSGKSSFFNSLIDINPYTIGNISITNKENIVYIPSSHTFKKELSWEEQLFYPAPPNTTLDNAIKGWMQKLSLTDAIKEKTPDQWSDGEKTRGSP